MNKEWVEEKMKLRQKEIQRIKAKIISQLVVSGLFDERGAESFIVNPKSVLNQENYDKYEDFYSKARLAEDFSALEKEESMDYEIYLDSDPVMFDGDIIITDPCYVIKEDLKGNYYNFKSVGVEHSMVRDTLYGDWSCTVYNTDSGEVLGNFCADAGMVSVLSLDEILQYNPEFDYHITKPWATTLIRNFKGSVQFMVKEDRWVLDRDTSYGKAGEELVDYYVEVVGNGINTKTGEPLNFIGAQTGL